MKYFLDTEFLEGTQRHRKSFLAALFATKIHTPPTIDLISIGIVAEDGGEYYAISKDFNLKEAWNRYDLVKDGFRDCGMTPNYKRVYWIRENVLKPIFIELRAKEVEEYNIAERRNVVLDFPTYSFCFKEFKRLINKYGKSNKEIAEEIKYFIAYSEEPELHPEDYYYKKDNWNFKDVQFYGYFADYDWVLVCWLFGKMIDLPKGFPMFAFDIQQQIEEYKINKEQLLKEVPQISCHNALQDAIWNKNAYNWIQKNKMNNGFKRNI